MSEYVLGFLTWVAVNLPPVLMAHPFVDFIGVFLAVLVIGLVAKLLRTRY